MTILRCKFCDCTERRACELVVITVADCQRVLSPEMARLFILPADAVIIPCEWIVPNVCSNPACVEKAYLESRELEAAA